MTRKNPATFVLRLVPLPEVDDPIRALRWALKTLLRRHGLKCTDIREERDGQQ
jgi:hypothetical protein